MKLRIWSLYAVGTVIAAISLFKMVPPLTRPGDFTDFGAGYMIGNSVLLLSGLLMIAIAWRRRAKG